MIHAKLRKRGIVNVLTIIQLIVRTIILNVVKYNKYYC